MNHGGHRPLTAGVLALALALAVGPGRAEVVPEPEGYHGEPYRSPVPATLAGARVIGDSEARELHDAGAAFVDVLPRVERPADLPEGTIWVDKPHDTIPGAIWLPNTGYEALAPAVESYLAAGLAAAAAKAPDRPIVIFCKSDCWMSWNAAKRALAMGVPDVAWYPAGVDGWAGMGLPLERVEPFVPE